MERTFLSEKTELHPPTEAEQLLFYVTRKKQVLGTADFLERLTGNYEDLWEKFGGESCFESFKEYKNFADARLTMTFIKFSNLRKIANPKPKEELVKNTWIPAAFWNKKIPL